ncbi:response regulator transcription factor [Kribbella sandramycini]|uniref:DNA-binding NarL/FixJ family response regulator n=1 Tax=Kribbella sandramycini TaxID=60450 RepID=A0A7Y4L4Q1_9ACTN|nr:response regulator transcription factor [Kribbella sandramycini]MBB6571232.1 DNA-binding NarL/FixJ family response regulator [Kribbella sandramycini]NOL43362.1 response regulator transcription factor [Kribbella sandramycini]
MNELVKVVVVDGHTLVRYGLIGLVGKEPDLEVVGASGRRAEVFGLVLAERPDVVVLDVSPPDLAGLRAARELRGQYAELGIVLLAPADQDDVLFSALESGVSAVVAKDAPTDEILAAIRHAAVAPTSFTATGLGPAMARRDHSPAQTLLSPREAQVLDLLGQGLSVRDIAVALSVSISTAKTYVARLYEKLEVSNRAQAIMTALQRGLLAPKP